MKKSLITGANGFVGRHLAKELEDNGYEVIKTSRFSDPERNQLKLNILDYEETYSVIHSFKPDYIFHLAGMAYVPSSWVNPRLTFEVNTLGSLNIFEAVRSIGLDTKIHIAGSSEEYGFVKEDEVPVNEDQPLRPISPYAVSKVAMDLLGYQYYKSYDLKVIRTRAFNHEGYGRGPQYMPSTFAKQIVEILAGKRESVIRHGDLSSKRDITDVRDTTRAYRLAVENCELGEVYNIGTGNTYTAGEILDMLIKLSNVKVTKIQDPQRMRPSDVKILQCDSTKFRKQTGWEPKYTIEETLSEVIRYWKERILDEKTD